MFSSKAADVLESLHLRLAILWRPQLHLMPLLTQAPRPVMRPAPRFPPDRHSRQLGHQGHHRTSPPALAEDARTPVVQADKMQDGLCEITTPDVKSVLHGTRSSGCMVVTTS